MKLKKSKINIVDLKFTIIKKTIFLIKITTSVIIEIKFKRTPSAKIAAFYHISY